jgi:glutathione S-transferase
MSKPILHGVNASPFVRKVRVALAEKGVDYDLDPIMPIGVSEDYKKLSPLGKIPCWEDGDYVLPDSSAIIQYLDRKHPEPRLYPEKPEELGRALWYEEYSDSKLTETVGPIFFNRVVVAKIMKGEPDPARIQEGLDGLPAVFDYLEGELSDGRQVLAGSHFSIADLAVCSPLTNLMHAGESLDASRWPNLAAYVERHHGRPSYKAIIEEEKANFAAL